MTGGGVVSGIADESSARERPMPFSQKICVRVR